MQAFNPFLPAYEYIPDGEPHRFGDRVYVYGSHDRFNAPMFCVNNYVGWSAPVNQLAQWRYEGVIYRRDQDPLNRLGLRLLFAPDVAQGPDGRFYLYYAFDFMGAMGVAVCDTPAGAYKFYGHVRFPDGHRWGSRSGEEMPFDPGVLADDDGRVYLYSGFATKIPFLMSRFHNLQNSGGVVMELEPDMLTIKAGPKLLFPRKGCQPLAGFEGHEFFEASSIRKKEGTYYFVYSSVHNHELCYATSSSPTEGFRFGGTLVSLGDVFLEGKADESQAVNYLGNTHGGLLEVNGQWYIFYHRQTNRHSYSRQACAERLTRRADGSFRQAEVTSCGLNNGPLRGLGEYEARIACNLWSQKGALRYDKPFAKSKHPYFTQTGKDDDPKAVQYIANMRSGAVAGFKYFNMKGANAVRVAAGGRGAGVMEISSKPNFCSLIAALPVKTNRTIVNVSGRMVCEPGIQPLYFRFKGAGYVDFYAFELMAQ